MSLGIRTLLTALGNIAYAILGVWLGHLLPQDSAGIVTGQIFVGVLSLIHLIAAHRPQVTAVLDSPIGQATEAMIEQKVAAAMALELQKITPTASTTPTATP